VRLITVRSPISLIPRSVPHQVDIIEYVNTDRSNQYTLHTGSRGVCRTDSGGDFDGNPLGTECRSGAGSNNGCGIEDVDGTAGAPFNAGCGGVVVMLWDETQLSFWRFARDEIPQDIRNSHPNPDSWGTPTARWTNESCDIKNSFRDMQSTSHRLRFLEYDVEKNTFFLFPVVINITICGDWAGSAYDNGNFPGTCAEAVADPSNYDGMTLSPLLAITTCSNFL